MCLKPEAWGAGRACHAATIASIGYSQGGINSRSKKNSNFLWIHVTSQAPVEGLRVMLDHEASMTVSAADRDPPDAGWRIQIM